MGQRSTPPAGAPFIAKFESRIAAGWKRVRFAPAQLPVLGFNPDDLSALRLVEHVVVRVEGQSQAGRLRRGLILFQLGGLAGVGVLTDLPSQPFERHGCGSSGRDRRRSIASRVGL